VAVAVRQELVLVEQVAQVVVALVVKIAPTQTEPLEPLT